VHDTTFLSSNIAFHALRDSQQECTLPFVNNILKMTLRNVGANIRRLRKERGWTLEELSEAMGTGIDTGSLSRLERGEQGYTTITLEMAARALGVHAGNLLQQPGAVYDVDESRGDDPRGRIPVVGTAQLGDDGYWHEQEFPVGHGDGHVRYYSDDPNCYALRVKGDSMRPRIKPGEFVVVEPNAATAPGDEVLVKVRDGRRMVKILHSRRNGQLELYSVNDLHRPLTLDEEQVEAVHRVLGIAPPMLYFPN
jgi:phage repressor protein C with HTH and peptisase S24 domain